MSQVMNESLALSQEVARLLQRLPALPPHLRYVDEHDDSIRTIRHPETENIWTISWDTDWYELNFLKFDEKEVRKLTKSFMAWLIGNGGIGSFSGHGQALLRLYRDAGATWFHEAVLRPVLSWRSFWDSSIQTPVFGSSAATIKLMLYFFADLNLGGWDSRHRNFIKSLGFRRQINRGAGVISGTSILSVTEESHLIGFFDDISDQVRRGEILSDTQMMAFCITCISYQHGLRSVQVSRMRTSDLRLYEDENGQPIFHFVGRRAKKRRKADQTYFMRKIRREWCWVFAAYYRWRMATVKAGKDTEAFPVSRRSIQQVVKDTTEVVSGTRRTMTDLRHSAAQRLADAGASVEEVANLLGHSSWETSLIYFEASESQAEQINKALSLNPVYSEIRNVAATRTIDKAKLLGLDPDRQIGAVPHGLPITGIGGCDLGQSLCELNPVLSCYTCRKFIPVDDADLHRQVLQDLRSVVRFFFDQSRGEKQSPAFAQLKVTLAAIQKLITELESTNEEGSPNNE